MTTTRLVVWMPNCDSTASTGDGQHQITGEAAEKLFNVSSKCGVRLSIPTISWSALPEPQPDEQDHDRAERAQRVGDDQRQQRVGVGHQPLGFFF